MDLPGGIERAIVNTSALLVKGGNKISLLILDETAETFYPLHPHISVIQKPLFFDITKKGNKLSRKLLFIKDLRELKKTLKALNPHTVIATEYHFSVMAVLSGIQSSSRVMSWEHHHFYVLKRNRFWQFLFDKYYPRLDGVIVLNHDEAKLFQKLNKNILVIPNFIDRQDPSVIEEHHDPTILTIVRLNKVKGIDLLLQVARSILKNHPKWKWKLIGQGIMKNDVLDFIAREGLQDQLQLFQPVSHQIFHDYIRSSFFVLPSRHECFPMVLLEAMSSGLPCIAFDCETGPRDIITDQNDGLLIEKENVPLMIIAIDQMIKSQEMRRLMSENAYNNVQRFSPEAVLTLWENVLG
ncbi:MAG TPA: glycosyltransferase family 4 protein [Flavisolibacter sp.]|nr:glycosyltransferase family 4 protein [Flavisolibacter sp.]